MVKDERRLIKITDTLCLSPQSYGARNSGMERFNVCVRTETGDLAGLEYIDRDSSGVYWFNDTSIGTIDSPDFAKYIRKFQFGPDLTAFEKKRFRIMKQNCTSAYQKSIPRKRV